MSKNMDRQFGIEGKSWYYFRYQELVITDKKLDAFDKTTYGAICKFADSGSGIAYPSYKTLQELIPCGSQRLAKSIKNLVKAGYLIKKKRKSTRKDGGHESNIYKVVDLSHISKALKRAKDNKNKKMETMIKERLDRKPIPDEDEIMDIVVKYRKEKTNKEELEELYESGYR
ncbi:MAG: helix-turn-helix domain-containing protein [Candidatus Woesearchaeota archaeon]